MDNLAAERLRRQATECESEPRSFSFARPNAKKRLKDPLLQGSRHPGAAIFNRQDQPLVGTTCQMKANRSIGGSRIVGIVE